MNRYAIEGAIRRAVADNWGHLLLNGDTELAEAALAAIAMEAATAGETPESGSTRSATARAGTASPKGG